MPKALVVDDSKTIRMILKRILIEIGFDVCEAGNGREALMALEDNAADVDLVLVDWNMPEMNGLEFVTEFRCRPQFAAARVIMVTTEAEAGHICSALEAGANEYVMKPFTKEILREKLEITGVLQYADR